MSRSFEDASRVLFSRVSFHVSHWARHTSARAQQKRDLHICSVQMRMQVFAVSAFGCESEMRSKRIAIQSMMQLLLTLFRQELHSWDARNPICWYR